MASLLDDNLFETRGQAPAPSKDFYQIIVTRKDATTYYDVYPSLCFNYRTDAEEEGVNLKLTKYVSKMCCLYLETGIPKLEILQRKM